MDASPVKRWRMKKSQQLQNINMAYTVNENLSKDSLVLEL